MNAPLLLSLPQLTISASLLIAAVLALRLTKHLPAQAGRLLWWLVLLRLLAPLRLPCTLSIWNWLPGPFTPSQAAPEANNLAATWQTTANALPENAAASPEPLNLAVQTSPAAISPWLLLWALGALLCAAYFGLAYLQCHRRFRQAQPPDGPAAAFVAEWLAAHPLRRKVRVLLSPDIDAPLTYGLLRPVILLPANADFSRQPAMHFAMLHEWTHIRHFDAAAKLLAAAALCLHWFNPLVWLFFGLFGRDLELACDAAVLQRSGCELPQRQAYANALLDWEQRRLAPAASLSTRLYNNFAKNVIEERIVAIMNMKKVSILSLTAAVLLLLPAMALALGTSPAQQPVGPLAINTNDLDDAALQKLSENETRRSFSEQLAPYEKFGLSWQFDDPDGDGNGLQMLYQGREVRGIWNEQTNSWFTEHSGIGFGPEAGELYTVYTDGKLSGLRWATPEEQAEWNQLRANNSRQNLLEYTPFGLEMDDMGRLFYQGQRVRYFWDGFDVKDDEIIGRALQLEIIDPDGEIDLRTRRQIVQNPDGSTNGMGPLLGLEVYQEENFAEMLKPAAQRITYASADMLDDERQTQQIYSQTEQEATYAIYNGDTTRPASGKTIAQRLAEYQQFGLEYQETLTAEGIKREIYFQGQLVEGFVDLPPNGGTFSVQSTTRQGASGVVRTVYDQNGQLSALRLATPEELAESWPEMPSSN